MKCLEKERSRRYDSAAALAKDLQRYLANEPVEAGPPSTSYRVGKFIRRHRPLAATIAVAVLLLLGATAVTTAAWRQAVRSRDIAQEAERRAEAALIAAERDRALAVRERAQAEAQRTDATLARDEAEAVTSFLTTMIESVEPDEQGRDVTVAQFLDQAAASIAVRMGDRPQVEARVRQTIGNAYRGLGLYERAEAHVTQAAQTLERELGESDPRTLRAMMNLAGFRQEQGRYAEAAAIGERVVALARPQPAAAPVLLGAMNNLALAYANLGRLPEAAELMEQTVTLMRDTLGPDHPHTLGATSNAGFMLADAGNNAGAERMLRQALEGWERVHGPEHPGTLLATSNLAGILVDLGRAEDGLALYQRVYDARVRLLGPDHPDTVRGRINLGYALEELGQIPKAESEYLAAWDATTHVLGPEHPDTLTVAMNVADLYADHGWPPEAPDLTARMDALVDSLRAIARRPDATADELNSCAWILLTIEPEVRRDPGGALMAAERACQLEREAAPGGGGSLWEYLDTLAMARARAGDPVGAREAQDEAIRLIPPHGEQYRAEMEARLREYGG